MSNLKLELEQLKNSFLELTNIGIPGSKKEQDIIFNNKMKAFNRLHHIYRLIIANGNLEGGQAKYLSDISVTVTKNGNAGVSYKNVMLGYYSSYNKLLNIRKSIDKLLTEDWFKKEIERSNI